MFDPTSQGAVLTDACRRDLYVFNRVLSKPNVHRAAGGEDRHAPDRFLRLDSTVALVDALSNSPEMEKKNQQTSELIAELSNYRNSLNCNPVHAKAGRYGGSYTAKSEAARSRMH